MHTKGGVRMSDVTRNLTEKEREQFYQLLYSQLRCVSDDERKTLNRHVVEANLAYGKRDKHQ